MDSLVAFCWLWAGERHTTRRTAKPLNYAHRWPRLHGSVRKAGSGENCPKGHLTRSTNMNVCSRPPDVALVLMCSHFLRHRSRRWRKVPSRWAWKRRGNEGIWLSLRCSHSLLPALTIVTQRVDGVMIQIWKYDSIYLILLLHSPLARSSRCFLVCPMALAGHDTFWLCVFWVSSFPPIRASYLPRSSAGAGFEEGKSFARKCYGASRP